MTGLVQLEIADRVEAFEAAVAALDTRIGGWSQPEVFVVADSSFYIQNEEAPGDWSPAERDLWAFRRGERLDLRGWEGRCIRAG